MKSSVPPISAQCEDMSRVRSWLGGDSRPTNSVSVRPYLDQCGTGASAGVWSVLGLPEDGQGPVAREYHSLTALSGGLLAFGGAKSQAPCADLKRQGFQDNGSRQATKQLTIRTSAAGPPLSKEVAVVSEELVMAALACGGACTRRVYRIVDGSCRRKW